MSEEALKFMEQYAREERAGYLHVLPLVAEVRRLQALSQELAQRLARIREVVSR